MVMELKLLKTQPAGGARAKVRYNQIQLDSSSGNNECLSAQTSVSVHPLVAEIFQCGPNGEPNNRETYTAASMTPGMAGSVQFNNSLMKNIVSEPGLLATCSASLSADRQCLWLVNG